MRKFLIIPQINNIDESLKLAEEYGFGFEYNDFFTPDILENESLADELISRYKARELPEYCTMHGDFFDVLIFSEDRRIREISELRIRQSLDTARKLGVKGVVFHTNHNPLLNTDLYIGNWYECNERFWRKILREYRDLEIYMENMFDNSPDMLAELAKRLSDEKNFGVCLDYAHAVIYGSDINDWTEKLSPYVRHIHINDNDLKNDLHLAVGDGKIDWNGFRQNLEVLSEASSALIETSSLESQRRSAEFLSELKII